ncbi:MAG: large-conductance mechanosensitive channel protein MscL [Planctomycetes bacterium]|jgi:large conductance mechanosensitive channel|nr:large-conductance mechanosensitive channel protein MscL [Planctomycetota bacterium]
MFANVLKEFKAFAMRGNVIDMAVGVIIGSAFSKIVSSLVSDILMPPLGLLLGRVDFKDLVITLKKAQYDDTGQLIADAVAIRYGVFLDNLIAFLIVAVALFILVKAINAMQKKEPAPAPVPPPPSKQEVLLEEIRDLLKDRCSQ